MRKKIPPKKKKWTKKKPAWAALGFDVSMSCMAGAAFAWDSTLSRMVGPVFIEKRWSRNTDYFIRLKDAALSPVLVHDLMAKLLLDLELEQIYIGVEEPVPMGMIRKGAGSWVKQQMQISGAFLGGLVRYGYVNIMELNNSTWKKPIADDLDVSLRDPMLKFKTKNWALDAYEGVPDWPDLIDHSKKGRIPRPEGSKAKAVQPDDRYDALGIMDYVKSEIEEGNIEVTEPVKRGAVGGGELR